TPVTLANATREADATKRKFEYKAHLLRSEFRPPNLAQKQRRCGGAMSVQGGWSSGTWNRALRAAGQKGPFAKETIARSVSPGFGDRPIKASSSASLHRTGDEGSETSRRARAQAQPRRGALLHDLAAEAEPRRRP